MATSMKKSVLGQGSDFIDEDTPMCEPCSVAGDYVPAYRFCSDCQEHLCQKCSKYHVSQKTMRNHKLLTLEDIHKAPPATATDKCSYKCNEHKDKRIKYYCAAHSSFGCSVCFTMGHKQCSTPVYIPTAAVDVEKNEGYKTFDTNLKSLETAYKAGLDDVEKLVKHVKADGAQIKTTFSDFRKRLNNELDKLEVDVTTKAKQIQQEETGKLKALSKELENSLGDIVTLTKKVDNLLSTGQKCDLYVMVKQDEAQLVRLSGELDAVTRDRSSKRFAFRPQHDLMSPGALGSLECSTENVSSGRNIPAIPARSRQAGQTKPADTRSTTPTSRKTGVVKTAPASRCRPSPAAPATRSQDNIDWEDMAARMKVGVRVRRGRDWGRKDRFGSVYGGDEDGGGLGTVVRDGGGGMWSVRWDRGGEEDEYRMGGMYDDIYDLQIVEL